MKQVTRIILVWLALVSTANAASFDCGNAANNVEKIICNDVGLSKIDEELNTAYKAALKNERQAQAIRNAQKKWMKARNDCPDAACVKRRYEKRLSELAKSSDSSSDLCLNTAPLHFFDLVIQQVCQSRITQLLGKRLDYRGMMGPLSVNTGGNHWVQLNTCSQYINQVGVGRLSPSRMESWTESGVYEPVCGTLYAVARAQKPSRSFLGKNPIALTTLPPTILPNGPTSDSQEELEAAFAKGQSAEDFLVSLKKKDSNFNRKRYLDGWNVVLLARADFDGDGVEDALVSYSYSPSDPDYHDFEYGIGVLKRLSSDRPAQWVEFNEFNWRR